MKKDSKDNVYCAGFKSILLFYCGFSDVLKRNEHETKIQYFYNIYVYILTKWRSFKIDFFFCS